MFIKETEYSSHPESPNSSVQEIDESDQESHDLTDEDGSLNDIAEIRNAMAIAHVDIDKEGHHHFCKKREHILFKNKNEVL